MISGQQSVSTESALDVPGTLSPSCLLFWGPHHLAIHSEFTPGSSPLPLSPCISFRVML